MAYIDLRTEGRRERISALVKGCRRVHALEDEGTIPVSQPKRFREYGEALIRDKQQSFAREESFASRRGRVRCRGNVEGGT